MCDLKLSPPLNGILPSSGLLFGVTWLKIDVSGLHIGSVLQGLGQLDP
jgi:hypothetical protein